MLKKIKRKMHSMRRSQWIPRIESIKDWNSLGLKESKLHQKMMLWQREELYSKISDKDLLKTHEYIYFFTEYIDVYRDYANF